MTVLSRAGAIVAALGVAAAFAFRPGVPGLHHDWLWPTDAHRFPALFAGGLSAFASHGYGGGGGTPSVNVSLLLFALLGALGVPSVGVLFVFVAASIVCAQLATEALLAELEPRLGSLERTLAAACYAFGPVLFQKLVAGHVYYVLAYALLPAVALLAVRGTRTERLGPFLGAGLAIAASSGQLQFLVFDTLVVLAIAAARPRVRTFAFAGGAIALGGLHNANAIAAALGAFHDVSLARFQATLQWELDQSAHPLDLAPLGGYLGYDRAALVGPRLALYDVGRWTLVVLACASLARVRRAHVVVCSGLALVALAIASGVYGPFAWLIPTLIHAPLFVLARELWHVMALYALALVVLAATGIGVMPRRLRVPVAVLAACVTLPFLANGLAREVPAVPESALATRAGAPDAGTSGGLVAEFPFAEPLALARAGDSAGVDPARLRDAVLSAGDPPPVVRTALGERSPDLGLLADLGIGAILDRPALVSALGDAFEPNVGADARPWRANEANLRARAELAIGHPRPLLALEAEGTRTSLDAQLADASMPPGARVPLASSYRDDDVDRSWVSGRGWWWQFPEYERLASDPVLTRGAQPYALALPRSGADTVDVLLAGGVPRLDGTRGTFLGFAGDGSYAWWQFAHATPDAQLTIGSARSRLRAIAAVVAGAQPSWRPPLEDAPVAPDGAGGDDAASFVVTADALHADRLSAVLPPSTRARTLVLRRAYSPGWMCEGTHLPVQAAVQTHGLFAGCRVPASSVPIRLHVFYAPARLTNALTALASAVELFVGCVLVLGFVRRRRAGAL